MKKIFSNLMTSRLLHFTVSPKDFGARRELIDSEEVLQLSCQSVSAGTKFRAHRHLPKAVSISELIAQESWVVISGKVRVTYFDLDDEPLQSHILSTGDVSVSLAGGHAYEILEDARILEFKTGPYLGQEMDKVFID